MAFDFDKLKDEIISVGKEVGDKVSGVSNIARLKLDLRSQEDALEVMYAELGHAYYEDNKDSEEDIPEKDAILAIKEAEAEVEETKKKLKKLQKSTGCPECGEKYQKGFKFCPFCGATLDVDSEDEDDIFEDEDDSEKDDFIVVDTNEEDEDDSENPVKDTEEESENE